MQSELDLFKYRRGFASRPPTSVRTTRVRNENGFMRRIVTVSAVAALAMTGGSDAYAAGPSRIADTYTATTTSMTPADLRLRIQIIGWQEAAARADVIATIAAGTDAAVSLAKLPTVGYVWPNGSPVGYSLKYAHRTPLPDGGERLALVTDRQIGSYDYRGWSVPSPLAKAAAPYSVIELYIDRSGVGVGSLSLAADVKLDEAAGTVALAEGAPTLLTDVKREVATH